MEHASRARPSSLRRRRVLTRGQFACCSLGRRRKNLIGTFAATAEAEELSYPLPQAGIDRGRQDMASL